MLGGKHEPRFQRESVTRALAIAALVLMAGMALFGPSGLLAWSENNRQLAERQKELRQLALERADLKNRVGLLDPHAVDPDMAGELLRKDLNVVHPDEMVMLLN